MRLSAIASLTSALFAATAFANTTPTALIPLPGKIEWTEPGETTLTAEWTVCYSNTIAKPETEQLAQMLRPATGFPLPVKSIAASPEKNAIWLNLDEKQAERLGAEGYELSVAPTGTVITAAAPAGLFYGGQTLLQLLPPAIFANSAQPGVKWEVRCCRIEDKPRFAWRGFMLDYSRHFFSVAYTKHLLDAMAMHKLNVFHMHLTDDDGWRIEIKKYPKLTEIGAWRGNQCAIPNTRGGNDDRYGGFFTQDQIREIVAYAAKLHIQVLPEIDLPGHCWALCTAYPETLPAQVNNSECTHGFKNNAISPAKESNYQMVEDIVAEVAALFPFPYLHVGGDEVNHNLWKDDPEIKALITHEKLDGVGGAQFYFTKRLEAIIAKHNRKMIGWNELFDPRLAKSTTIMAWIGEHSGLNAARNGNSAIQAYGPRTYFNIPYRGNCDEPKGHHAFTPFGVKDTYGYDPLAGGKPLTPEQVKNVLGVHGCLWTEFVTPFKSSSGWLSLSQEQNADYQIFPRLCALAETGWTPKAQQNDAAFDNRLYPHHLSRLSGTGVTFRIPPPTVTCQDGIITITPPYAGADIRYTVDGSDPFNSPTAREWDGKPITAAPQPFRARTLLDGKFSPLVKTPKAMSQNKIPPSPAAAH